MIAGLEAYSEKGNIAERENGNLPPRSRADAITALDHNANRWGRESAFSRRQNMLENVKGEGAL